MLVVELSLLVVELLVLVVEVLVVLEEELLLLVVLLFVVELSVLVVELSVDGESEPPDELSVVGVEEEGVVVTGASKQTDIVSEPLVIEPEPPGHGGGESEVSGAVESADEAPSGKVGLHAKDAA